MRILSHGIRACPDRLSCHQPRNRGVAVGDDQVERLGRRRLGHGAARAARAGASGTSRGRLPHWISAWGSGSNGTESSIGHLPRPGEVWPSSPSFGRAHSSPVSPSTRWRRASDCSRTSGRHSAPPRISICRPRWKAPCNSHAPHNGCCGVGQGAAVSLPGRKVTP